MRLFAFQGLNLRGKELFYTLLMALLCGIALVFNFALPIFLIVLIWACVWLSRGNLINVILLFLIAYMPFDSYILSYLPGYMYLYVKYLSTGIIFIISIALIMKNHKKLFLLKKIPGILFLLLYIVTGFVSAFINKVNLPVTITTLQQELRYIPLFIALSMTAFDDKFIKKCLKIMIIVGAVNVLIGALQLCAGKYVTPYLVQRSVEVGSEVLTTGTVQFLQKAGLLFGVFPAYNAFGIYLTILFLLIVAINRYRVFRGAIFKWMGVFVFVILIFTLSRQSIMAALMGYLLILVLSGARKVFPLTLLFAGLISFILFIGLEMNLNVSNPQRLTFVYRVLDAFSPTRWNASYTYGRMALTLLTIKTLVSHNSLFFGLGPGNWGNVLAWKQSALYTSILESSPASLLNKSILADVNWASILGQYGIIGIMSFLMLLVSLFRYSLMKIKTTSENDSLFKTLSLAMAGIVFAISLAAFFGPWFASRSIAFYFWLLAGLMVSLGNYRRYSVEADQYGVKT